MYKYSIRGGGRNWAGVAEEAEAEADTEVVVVAEAIEETRQAISENQSNEEAEEAKEQKNRKNHHQ